MADAENNMANTDRNSVNFNSFFTPFKALINNFNDPLFRHNLKMRVSRKSLRIRRNLPSIETN